MHPGGVKTNIATAALEAARRAGSTVTPEQEARFEELLTSADVDRACELAAAAFDPYLDTAAMRHSKAI